MKRIFTLLLTLVMTFSLAIPAQAANNTKASTMRLMETEGTATVENAIGKKLSIQDKMQLYSGYEVSTEKASYAYISLDNNKAVKLDASSAVKVNQSGKKLELDVTAGELMFNVPVALKSDESLNIRTSTMVTGIRGTAGWVNALDRYTTRVGVLEGSVTIQSKDPFTGADRSVTIVGGQIATIIRHERANAIQQQLIDDGVIIEENIVAELTEPGQIVEEIQEADIPGFVAEEVSSNSDLQDRISEESPLNVDEIIKDADKRLAEEEKATEKQDALIQKELKELDATNPGLPFAAPEVIIQTNTVRVPGETVREYVSLDHPDAANVNTILAAKNIAAVTNADEKLILQDLVLDSDDILYILSGTLNIKEDEIWNVRGTVHILGETTLNNNGTIRIHSKSGLHVSGTLNNNGFIDLINSDETRAGLLQIEPAGILKNGTETGQMALRSIETQNVGIYPEIALLDTTSAFVNYGTFYNYDSGHVYAVADTSSPVCAIENYGALYMMGGSIEAHSYDNNCTAVYHAGTKFVFDEGDIVAFANAENAGNVYAAALFMDIITDSNIVLNGGRLISNLADGLMYGTFTSNNSTYPIASIIYDGAQTFCHPFFFPDDFNANEAIAVDTTESNMCYYIPVLDDPNGPDDGFLNLYYRSDYYESTSSASSFDSVYSISFYHYEE